MTVHAPELDGGVAWINTDRPLTLRELRGHVVLLDFWTAGCVNCLHQSAEIALVEEAFADRPFVVIGVHDGKFEAEKDVTNVAAAVRRHGIRHPVVVDPHGVIRDRFAVRSWPASVIVDPQGAVAQSTSGELGHEQLVAVIRALLAGSGVAKERVAIRAPAPPRDTPLAQPGKVLATGDGELVIADSGHHRIIITTQDGRLRDVAGSGLAGARDGGFAVASFQNPQGLARRGDRIWVADAGNHAIRCLDLSTRTVTTIARDLRSPWDLALDGEKLFIAMAGSHQIHVMEGSEQPHVFAGAGHEGLVDGPRAEAQFAQPSALALLGGALYVADAESSSIRVIENERVETVAGAGLFEFGDRDGAAVAARLQHASGLCVEGATLLIADSYNGKIKRYDPQSDQLTTVLRDLGQPGGVSAAGGRIFVADTDASRIVVGGQPLEILRLSPPPLSGISEMPGPSLSALAARETRLEPVALAPGDSALLFELELAGLTATEGAPFSIAVTSSGAVRSAVAEQHEFHASLLPLRIPVAIDGPSVAGDVRIDVEIYVCAQVASRCTILRVVLVQPVIGGGSSHEARVALCASPAFAG